MTVTEFGYLILITIEFYDFISPFSPWFYFRMGRNIKHLKQCFHTVPKNWKFVDNTQLRIIFPPPFSVFGNGVKCVSCV